MKLQSKSINPLTPLSAGTYVSVTPNAAAIKYLQQLASALGIPLDAAGCEELHCTLIHAKGTFANNPASDPALVYPARIKDIQFWNGHNNEGYIVAVLDSPTLEARHKVWLQRGLVHSFADYTPHVTLKTGVKMNTFLEQRMVRVAEAAQGTPLLFTNEITEGIKTDAEKAMSKLPKSNSLRAARKLSPAELRVWDDLYTVKATQERRFIEFLTPMESKKLQAFIFNPSLPMEYEIEKDISKVHNILGTIITKTGTIEVMAGLVSRPSNRCSLILLASKGVAASDRDAAVEALKTAHSARLGRCSDKTAVMSMALPGSDNLCVACGNPFNEVTASQTVCSSCADDAATPTNAASRLGI